MIALLGIYAELLSKLDKDEQIKYINKAILIAKKEPTKYEEKHVDTASTLIKLRKIKSEILNNDTLNSYIYPILQEDKDGDMDRTNELK